MAHNEIEVNATPERVFEVLADVRSFARWVVGSQRIRRADADWPAPDTAFDHAVGVGWLHLKDHSRVLESVPPGRLRLLVNIEPLATAFVTLRIGALGASRSRVVMEEEAADARSRILLNRLTDPLVALRNHESLRRLKALAEGREEIPAGELPPRGGAPEGAVTGSSKPASTG